MHRKRESGKGRVGLIIAVAVVASGIFAGAKFIPVRVAAYELRDFVEQECRHAAARRSDEHVRRRILEKADELEIPLEAKRVKVKRTRKEMVVTASYEHPIDFRVTTYHYKVDIRERAPLF